MLHRSSTQFLKRREVTHARTKKERIFLRGSIAVGVFSEQTNYATDELDKLTKQKKNTNISIKKVGTEKSRWAFFCPVPFLVNFLKARIITVELWMNVIESNSLICALYVSDHELLSELFSERFNQRSQLVFSTSFTFRLPENKWVNLFSVHITTQSFHHWNSNSISIGWHVDCVLMFLPHEKKQQKCDIGRHQY